MAATSREISKIYEDTQRGTLTQLINHFTQTVPRGEFVIVVEWKRIEEEQ